MEAIASGDADYAVMPIENSSAGIVPRIMISWWSMDTASWASRLSRSNMPWRAGAKLSDITDVYSHPQALMQCARYLEGHREWEKHSLKNTAMAAQKVREDGMRHKAAIASRLNGGDLRS